MHDATRAFFAHDSPKGNECIERMRQFTLYLQFVWTTVKIVKRFHLAKLVSAAETQLLLFQYVGEQNSDAGLCHRELIILQFP